MGRRMAGLAGDGKHRERLPDFSHLTTLTGRVSPWPGFAITGHTLWNLAVDPGG
jgi:hypothetical protein